jgi:hypothetical protein
MYSVKPSLNGVSAEQRSTPHRRADGGPRDTQRAEGNSVRRCVQPPVRSGATALFAHRSPQHECAPVEPVPLLEALGKM